MGHGDAHEGLRSPSVVHWNGQVYLYAAGGSGAGVTVAIAPSVWGPYASITSPPAATAGALGAELPHVLAATPPPTHPPTP